MTKDQIFDTLERSAQQILPDLGGSVQRTDSFDALGINSLDLADIAIATLDKLQLDIPLNELAGAKTFGELADTIHAKS
ncbi:acyl carrier protein [Agrobacterium rhizogenes]|uniref:phosphopantetheine-binding protein n=1 Tax=Rhizobium rhizogenes TaxID=359 RepID=UPI00157224FA|nr:phosphopantetheine-binding protein [Rhizobium rhizogenes]NTG49435.1 acyl carrier protein [Rhizobium rhizogenes]